MGLPLPNEIHLLIANYIYYSRGFGAKNHSNYSIACKTTKCIMDSLAKKDGFSNYLHRSLYFNDRCNDCYCKVSTRIDDFFDKNYKLCGSCNSKRPKLSSTQIKAGYLLEEHEFGSLPYFTTRNQYRVYCRYFLQSDIEELQEELYTQEEIRKFYLKRRNRVARRIEIKREKEHRAQEIKHLLRGFSELAIANASNTPDCVKYVQKNIPKNPSKRTELVSNLIDIAIQYDKNPPPVPAPVPEISPFYGRRRTWYRERRWS